MSQSFALLCSFLPIVLLILVVEATAASKQPSLCSLLPNGPQCQQGSGRGRSTTDLLLQNDKTSKTNKEEGVSFPTSVEVYLITDTRSHEEMGENEEEKKHHRFTSSLHPNGWWHDKKPWESVQSAAAAKIKHSMNTTGWDGLTITTNSALSESQQSYAAGYAEGLVTWNRIYQLYLNSIVYNGMPSATGQVATFINEQIAYVNFNVANNPNDKFWISVGSAMSMLQGMADGYNIIVPPNLSPSIGFFELYVLNFQTEIGEVAEKFKLKTRLDYGRRARTGNATTQLNGRDDDGGPSQAQIRSLLRSLHCSAIIKVTDNDVFMAHATWGSVTTMLRTIKEYNFGFYPTGNQNLRFSSYPGMIHSDDDFYMLSNGLFVQETTNANYNSSLNDEISSQTVPEFIRIVVANRLATNGSTWATTFSMHNSGTYNNQWMIVDLNLYSPGVTKPATLPNGFFTVLEQMPNLIHWEDLTWVLRERQGNFWPSYNVPYFPDIYIKSENALMETKYGPFWSYNFTSRRKLFDMYASSANDIKSIQALIRLNDCPTNPLCNCSTCAPNNFTYGKAIAARCDLAPVSMDSHDYCTADLDAIDAKVTSYSLMMMMNKNRLGNGNSYFNSNGVKGEALVIGAPTYTTLPPFNWSTFQYKSKYTVVGMPDSYDFGWYNMSWFLV